ncbi:MAG TPA: ATP-grasp domain-containing protein [Gemmatimonadota bacterium]
MRILAYERFSALGCRAPRALFREGGAMLAGLASDLAAAGHRVVTAVGPDVEPGWLPGLRAAGVEVVRRRPPEDGGPGLRELLSGVEAAWIVGPETGGVLEEMTREVLAEGKTLLGSTPAAVALAGSKLGTAAALEAAGVAVVPTLPLPDAELPAGARAWGFPLVVKPEDGVGSEGVGLVRSGAELAQATRRARRHAGAVVIQPYVPGTHASVSLLVGPAGAFPLALQGQDVRLGRTFRYHGGEVPLEAPSASRALALARSACAAVPGLAGFVGVDLVLADGGPVVVEINPRLTTAYLGLRRACAANVAALALEALDGRSPSIPRLDRRVRFTTGGRVTEVRAAA